MSDELYKDEKHISRLYAWGLIQMLRGAGWAALVFIGLILFALILLGIKELLPVNPYASLHVVRALTAFA